MIGVGLEVGMVVRLSTSDDEGGIGRGDGGDGVDYW